MELEERIARLEGLIAQNEKLARWEFTVFKWGVFVLFVIAVCAFVVWGGCEFLAFAIERVSHLAHTLTR
jgi:hypothetical protein